MCLYVRLFLWLLLVAVRLVGNSDRRMERKKKGKEDLLGFVVLVSTREVTHKASFCFDFVLLLAGQLLYMEPDVVTCVPLRLLRCEKDSTKPRHWPGFFLWF